MRYRIDWCNVQRRVARTPHLRCVVGSYRGRPALVRGTAVLATSPAQAFDVLDRLLAVEEPRAAA